MQKKSITFNTKALATLALCASAVPCAIAQTAVTPAVTIYGRLDIALEANNDGQLGRTALQNFSSRLGFKGEREFSNGLTGLFQVETGFAPDDTAQSKSLASRNSYVGLKSKSLGTLIAGTHDMPLKSLEGTANQLWGEGEAMEVIIHGKGSRSAVNGGGVVFNNVHTRQTNMVQYTAPKFYNITAKLAYSPDEVQTAAVNKALYGASAEYKDGTFNLGVAYQNQFNVSANGGSMTAVKLTGGVKLGDIAVGAAYSNIDNNAGPVHGRKTDNYLVTGSYTLGAMVFKANYGQSSTSGALNKDDGLSMMAIEADYALDKQVTLYTYYASINNNKDAKGTFAAADNFPAVTKAGDKPSAFGVGIRYNF